MLFRSFPSLAPQVPSAQLNSPARALSSTMCPARPWRQPQLGAPSASPGLRLLLAPAWSSLDLQLRRPAELPGCRALLSFAAHRCSSSRRPCFSLSSSTPAMARVSAPSPAARPSSSSWSRPRRGASSPALLPTQLSNARPISLRSAPSSVFLGRARSGRGHRRAQGPSRSLSTRHSWSNGGKSAA